MSLGEKIWYRWLKRPYILAVEEKVNDSKVMPVVFLHGLASSSHVWDPVLDAMDGLAISNRRLTVDLLGFGESPKPDWLAYNTDDHARMVIATLVRRRVKKAVLVGHSMGCLIAVRVARLRPDLVKQLILYEMPLYSGLPDKRTYRIRLNLYFKFYERVIAYRPIFKGPGVGKAQKFAERVFGLKITDQTWRPFIKSLKHTIMQQTTSEDLKHIKAPMDVIYGSRDRVVIKGKTKALFGEDATNIQSYTVKASHNVSKKASLFIAQRIQAAVNGETL